MTFETLYKRTKTGAIQSYDIWVDADTTDGLPVIMKSTGQLTGKKTVHTETIFEGKNIGRSNETTPLQQAESQAQSDWTRKHDEGYKSLKDLGITPCTVGPLVGQYMMNTHGLYTYGLEYCLQQSLPQFNSDASGNVKPMLAKTVNWDKVIYPCLVQPKLDGVRCLMIATINDNGSPSTVFLSRSGKEYTTLDHIRTDVDSYMYSWLPGNFILDGEIYSDELTFQEIIAAVKKQRPDSLKLKFRAYDIVNDKHQTVRYLMTEDLVKKIESTHIKTVETITCSMQSQVKELHNKWVSEGNEGAMIRLTAGTYDQGQRSSSLLKVKEFDETEFAFRNFEFGQRGVEDLIAVCWDKTGEKEFRAKVIGTREQKYELYDQNDSSEGKSFTIKHFGYTTDGLPRFPIGKGFRDY